MRFNGKLVILVAAIALSSCQGQQHKHDTPTEAVLRDRAQQLARELIVVETHIPRAATSPRGGNET